MIRSARRLSLTLLAALALAACGEDGEGGESATTEAQGDAYIQELSGSPNDLAPDDRLGTAPPPSDSGSLAKAAEAAGCDAQLDLRDEGNTHIQPGEPPPRYGTTPPASGDHIVPPLQQADGAYSEPAEDINVVHALEHGRVAIQYSPDLPEEAQLALKGLFDEDPAGMLLFPNPALDGEVAATAWTRLLSCQKYDGPATLGALRVFRDLYRGNGPEPVPIVIGG